MYIFLHIFSFITTFFSPLVAHAYDLELPSFANATDPASLVNNIYMYALGIAGTLAVVMIVYGGVKYVVTGGNSSAQKDAIEIIKSAVWGIVLLGGAFLILNTINPTLTVLKNPGLTQVQITVPTSTGSLGYSGGESGNTVTGKSCQNPVSSQCVPGGGYSTSYFGNTCFSGDNACKASSIANLESHDDPTVQSGIDVFVDAPSVVASGALGPKVFGAGLGWGWDATQKKSLYLIAPSTPSLNKNGCKTWGWDAQVGASGCIALENDYAFAPSPKKYSFSIGLFQINILQNWKALGCADASTFITTSQCLVPEKKLSDGRSYCPLLSGAVTNVAAYNDCVAKASNVQTNLAAACSIEKSGGWNLWGTNANCGF